MKLYMNALSPNVRRVRLTAAVLGIELQEINVDLGKGEHKTPDYLALNPQGAVPTFVDDDGTVLTESRAIMQYLASKKPNIGLLPTDERERAEVTRWQFFDASHFSPNVASYVFETMFKSLFKMGEPSQAKVEEALVAIRRFGGLLDKHLAGRTYVATSRLTVADLTLAATLQYAKRSQLPLEELPNVAAWFDRIEALEAWRATEPG